MAAYAALVSLKHIIDDLHHHPRPPISLPKEQVASLTSKLAFLQEFLQGYNTHLGYSTEADPLEMRIADAAYAAEDAIETQIAEKMSSDTLHRALEKVIEEMTLIEKKAMKIKEATGVKHQQQRKSTPLSDSPSSSSSSVPQKKSMMVGADDLLLEMKNKLTSNARDLQIIPIVGMGGSGKTTLALNIYQDTLIMEHFDIRAWATVSLEYNIRQILVNILKQLIKEFDQDLSEGELGEILHKHVYGRRYLIIMDDMWGIGAWDRVRNFFPNNCNRSRIVVTTRLSNLSSKLSTSNSLSMSLLDEAHSWFLLSKIVFGEKGCPRGLEDIGKKIGKGCKGLPLSIVAVGGFLAKSKHTLEFWEHIDENLNSIVNLKDDERCLRILYMSYKQLPVHLKPCFLYMGVFPEDEVIRVSRLVRFWVAEGFLKGESGKTLEEIGNEYLEEIVDRNLVMIDKMGISGNIKECKIHDSLRDLCLREARKQRFYDVVTKPKPPTRRGLLDKVRFDGVFTKKTTGGGASLNVQRRIVIPTTASNEEALQVFSSLPRARSLICYPEYGGLPLHRFDVMLLRILQAYETPKGFSESVHRMVNARLLSFSFLSPRREILSSMSLVWNLQTLSVSKTFVTAPSDIWYMPHIRHVRCPSGIHLLDPPDGSDGGAGLRNLQTMRDVRNFKLSEQVVKRIPNIKKLEMSFMERTPDGDGYCLTDLDRLDKLESLTCSLYVPMHPSVPDHGLINLPHSLKKLSLYMDESPCAEEMLEKIGVLPHLQKLRLLGATFKEREWTTTQGQFPSLKYLQLGRCKGLSIWTTESSHFPHLEHLHLSHVYDELEIPLDLAEIATLRVIELTTCKAFVIGSAKRVLEEHEELYGEEETTLQVQVLVYKKEKEHDSLAGPNFRFTYLHSL